MLKFFRTAFCAVLSFALMAPANAYDQYTDTLDARGTDLYAGAYVTFRFGGSQNANSGEEFKFGFRAGLQAPNRGFLSTRQYDLTGRRVLGQQRMNLTFLDTAFDQQGFDKLSLAGAPLVFRGSDGQIYVLGVDGEEGEDNDGSALKTAGKVVLWTGVVIVGAMAAAALATCVDGESKEEAVLDFCPLN